MKRIIGCILLITLILSGCSNNKKETPNINKYNADKEMLEYHIDTVYYAEAIEDLIYYSGWSKSEVQAIIDKYSELLTEDFKIQYMSLASEDIEIDESMNPSDIGEMTDDELNQGLDGYVDIGEMTDNELNQGLENNDDIGKLGTDEDENIDQGEEDGHGDMDDPVLNMSYKDMIYNKFIAYALEDSTSDNSDNSDNSNNSDNYYDESEDDEEHNGNWWNFDTEEKVYQVHSIDAYPNYLVANVSYLYGANMKVLVSLVDNKIDGYQIYR